MYSQKIIPDVKILILNSLEQTGSCIFINFWDVRFDETFKFNLFIILPYKLQKLYDVQRSSFSTLKHMHNAVIS